MMSTFNSGEPSYDPLYGFNKNEAWKIDYDPTKISLQEPEPVGTSNSVPIPGPSGVPVWRVGRKDHGAVTGPSRFDRFWTMVAAILFAAAVAIWISGCIPVTIRPEFDDHGLPKALPVAPVGNQDLATGDFHPPFPVSQDPPSPPPSFPWETILQVALGVLGVGGLGGAGIAVRGLSKARTAIRIVADLADANANAETDADVVRNKMIAAQLQEQAGVRTMTQKARGK